MDNMREYKLTRSKRKTIAIRVNEDSSLEVKAPLYLSREKINNFVNSKEKWIAKNTKEISEKYQLKKEFNVNFNDYIILRGKKAYIRPIKGNNASYDEEKGIFYIPEIATTDQIKELIIEFYKLISKSYIPSRIRYFSKKMNVTPTAIRITSAKTRWGSCSGKNSVNFSWKLIMADDKTIDYVIIHELAHIKQHNHSNKFWNIVESMMPDYKEQKEELKILGEKLSKENWELNKKK
ncbi:M48 family metallopeptidase [Methanobrevibacter sp. TMH8]|uniref:M48 family metallopeptidase n=1 Tax=Methanobrevibacter sp. TMH8 TaxID=2848611 RepID=UPI001CCD3583|nr:SprT family zinc-dependent metalloprotease [Methanobrevibacter sp. TMH8]MBZ9570605.1 M48 family metallopeptidase [Methanobrevibacter sp. TMH8]